MEALQPLQNDKRRSTPARMEPLAKLPVFFGLEGKRVVLAGGSDGAAWKAELLVACGATVHVFCPEHDLGEVMRGVIAEHSAEADNAQLLIPLPGPSPRTRGEGDRRTVSVPEHVASGTSPLPASGERARMRGWAPKAYSAAGLNCSVSVDSFIAVVEDWPPVMASETASK